MSRSLIIQGSARSDGDTQAIALSLQRMIDSQIVTLSEKNISYFDYSYSNRQDDFLPIVKEFVAGYDHLVFITPVYWYTMSGRCKVFLDRITDLLNHEKDLGRKLRGKAMGVISVSNHDDLKEGFAMPFEETAIYLGMNYMGSTHTWIEEKNVNPIALNRLMEFAQKY